MITQALRDPRIEPNPDCGYIGHPSAGSLRLVSHRNLYDGTINPLRYHRARNLEGRRM